ncbi:MAG: glucose-1-phosphate adenylyltransferase [Alphaproteobacteria bacterium]|nr:glucose-1-phosphate adenylyltransferase [Alphaproteobacteria bacterium]MCB9694003.1 glucose-1-phosphate adenylyltransferase [Alphaproteobacteria bacterium]
MIMAGGKGSRLGPLTTHRAKPAMPFGGRYRIIDFVLSNFVNSGYRNIYVLTQYMASSLIKHLNRNWHLSSVGDFIEEVPAQMRTGENWYLGTADSVYQNINLIRDARSELVAIFGGDHIYKFDVRQMEDFHRAQAADLTIAAFPVPREEAHQFGVIQIDETGRITGFQEKPANPATIPGRPDMCLVSMGNYIFNSRLLVDALIRDARDPNSQRDFGKNVIPALLADGMKLMVYDFTKNRIPGEADGSMPYWRDVGTIESYFKANMELRSALPTLNLYNRQWRVRTAQRDYPPARFVRHEFGRPVDVVDSLVCEGSIVQSAALHEAVLGYDCFVHANAHIVDSILLSGCDVGEDVRLKGVLCDKNCAFEKGARAGVDPEEDRERFPFITENGIIVLPKGTRVPKSGPIEIAYDIGPLLEKDSATRDAMAAFAGRYTLSHHNRHSYRSRGPRSERTPLHKSIPSST